MTTLLSNISKVLLIWIDSEYMASKHAVNGQKINWIRCIPFIGVHIACLAVIWVGWSWPALIVCALSYFIRMFAITGFYHRYFSHRSFKTNRFWQFIFAVMGASATQRGPLWWAGHHRHHHQHSDTELDTHSPVKQGFLWSHMQWFICDENFATPKDRIKDFAKYPELRFLNRYDMLVPILYAIFIYSLGYFINLLFPSLETSGAQFLIWGYFIATVLLFHATFAINSLGHVFGKQRYATKDNSRNNRWLAIITLGEGWHNNHHRWPIAARQGFFWWEIDITYYLLKLLSYLKIISDLNPVPKRILEEDHG